MQVRRQKLPITHWSHSSLMAFLRNPLAWHKRYVEEIYDTPSSPAAAVGRACHKALEHFYGGLPKESAVALGLEYLRDIPDFEINFGRLESHKARMARRAAMEREYLQAIGFYLERPIRYRVLGVEVKSTVKVEGLPLPIKAVSDLVVRSAVDPSGLDVIDHKFVSTFSSYKSDKPLYVIQAIFNYYAVKKTFGKPVRRFIIRECKISKNKDGRPQIRRHVVDFRTFRREFIIFNRLVRDATAALAHTKVFLPNPSDIFEGEDSFALYHLNLKKEDHDTHFRPDE
jgi:hypothetical protein